jgi:hypothetical protein
MTKNKRPNKFNINNGMEKMSYSPKLGWKLWVRVVPPLVGNIVRLGDFPPSSWSFAFLWDVLCPPSSWVLFRYLPLPFNPVKQFRSRKRCDGIIPVSSHVPVSPAV